MSSTDKKSKDKPVAVVEDRDLFLRQLMPFLRDIEGKWKEFGTALEISEYEIDNIRVDCFGGASNAECCMQMFALWRRSTTKDKRTWFMIKEAARTLEMQDLIKKLEANEVHGMIIVCMYYANNLVQLSLLL